MIFSWCGDVEECIYNPITIIIIIIIFYFKQDEKEKISAINC